jgi:hypothetical protein
VPCEQQLCSLLVLLDAEWVTISLLLNYPRHQRGASVRFRGLVLGVGEDAFWLPGFNHLFDKFGFGLGHWSRTKNCAADLFP